MSISSVSSKLSIPGKTISYVNTALFLHGLISTRPYFYTASFLHGLIATRPYLHTALYHRTETLSLSGS
jgi:hypothetical protein